MVIDDTGVVPSTVLPSLCSTLLSMILVLPHPLYCPHFVQHGYQWYWCPIHCTALALFNMIIDDTGVVPFTVLPSLCSAWLSMILVLSHPLYCPRFVQHGYRWYWCCPIHCTALALFNMVIDDTGVVPSTMLPSLCSTWLLMMLVLSHSSQLLYCSCAHCLTWSLLVLELSHLSVLLLPVFLCLFFFHNGIASTGFRCMRGDNFSS